MQRQRIVDGVGTGAVGMADDAHFGIRVVAQAVGEAVQDGGEIAGDVRAAGGEGNVAGDVQLELVVRRLGHAHARALGRGFHLALLLLEVLRPDVRAQSADASADQGALAGMAARDGADGGTAQGTHASASGRAARGVGHAVHVRAARDEQCRGQGSRQSQLLAHRKLLFVNIPGNRVRKTASIVKPSRGKRISGYKANS